MAIEFVMPQQGISVIVTLADVEQQGAAVPSIWRWEVANTLLRAERQGKLRSAAMLSSLAMLMDLPLEIEDMTDDVQVNALLPMARAERMTLFDAAYLDLAERTGLPLATLDGGLAAAAARRGVTLLPLTP